MQPAHSWFLLIIIESNYLHSTFIDQISHRSCFHWLDQPSIFPSLVGSATDLAFIGWISHLSCLHWLDQPPILPSLVGSTTDLAFIGWINHDLAFIGWINHDFAFIGWINHRSCLHVYTHVINI
ncbi:hypothetical protein RF55_8356 [Lasius niger]|uniref:Uncharacterized protein n=1 Tax=Lasius niger TaxID=67767 RepID=A0A0J7NGT7_LASNI|nr:hypothetical protein RF55_8356 [Lasius niger]